MESIQYARGCMFDFSVTTLPDDVCEAIAFCRSRTPQRVKEFCETMMTDIENVAAKLVANGDLVKWFWDADLGVRKVSGFV